MAEIVGAVTGLLGLTIEVAKCIAKPIKRQFNYLCCFNSNIHDLRKEAKRLEDRSEVLQGQVNAARNNAEVVVSEVSAWMEKANEKIQVDLIGIESEIANIQSGGLAVKSRYSLSKKAKKTTEAMKQLWEDCKFDPISHPPPPSSMVSIPLGSTNEFESRKHIEEDIMINLRDSNVNMIGICGIGGVGKTTMAQRVMERAKNENLFDETVMVVVGQLVHKLKIQKEMAELLGLDLKEENLASRAYKLQTRLTGGKRILIVVDDVWEYLNLEELIRKPRKSGLQGCTILLTSRDKDVLNEMEAQRVCEIQTLAETEAWSLFREKDGAIFDDQNLLSIAQKIVRECRGLPIALVNIATALKVRKYKSSWEDALKQLQSCNPVDMPKILEHVYKPLKLSYDFLDSQHGKSIFLLCCLFPEDHNISLEYLAFYAMGLRLFEDVRNLGQARNRLCSLVEMLKSRFLLLNGIDEYHVRMHDVVRDVAIFIATEERRIRCSDCTWISPHVGETIDLPTGSIFPNLRLVLIHKYADEELQYYSCLGGGRELNVLYVESLSLRSFPHTTQVFENLKTLILKYCDSLESIFVVGELVSLEILVCHYCDSIEELPVEMRRLNRLRLLEILGCRRLKTIAPGIISSLIGLEELKITESFDKWDNNNEGKEGKNASLSELESLSNLTCLEIEVEDSTLVSQQIQLSPEIVKFNISIGGYKSYYSGFEKEMNLHLPREIALGNWIHKFLRSVECLRSSGDGSSDFDVGQARSIRSLTLRECSTMKKLLNTTTSSDDERCVANSVFSGLEYLELYKLINLEEICDFDGPISEVSSSLNYSLQNLKELKLGRLHALRYFFPLSAARDCFSQLERLEIKWCDVMEQVFWWNEDENEKNIGEASRRIAIFPKLKSVEIFNLPNLTTLCKGIESIEFPLLTEMDIDCCPKLESLVSSSGGINVGHDDDDHSLHLLCKQKVSFGNLKRLRTPGNRNLKDVFCPQIPVDFFTKIEDLEIDNYRNIKSLLSFSMARNLVSLKFLTLKSCDEMERVIAHDKKKDACESMNLLFPNLEKLHLGKLPELKSFCDWRCALELPKLEEMKIYDCPKMGRFSLGSLSIPNLKTLSTVDANCTVSANEYLNDARQIETLRIFRSQMMEQVVLLLNEEENDENSSNHRHRITFAELKNLDLYRLPRLTTFCKGVESIEFPMLTHLFIEECPNLKSFVSTTTSSDNHSNSDHDYDHDALHLFCNPKVAFSVLKALGIVEHESNAPTLWCNQIQIDFFTGLEYLRIESYGKIRSLFSYSIAANLINLKTLVIRRCEKMIRVIEDKEEELEGKYSHESSTLLFPNLQSLYLESLPELKSFCELRSYSLKLPSLKEGSIADCPKMERFTAGSLTTPNLTTISIGSSYVQLEIYSDDLNGTLQQHFLKAKEEDKGEDWEDWEEDI